MTRPGWRVFHYVMSSPTGLKFGAGNGKLAEDIATFSLPSGYSCPGARACLAKANIDTGRITDGPHQEFRCFSASTEAAFPSTRISRWNNYKLLIAARTVDKMAKLLISGVGTTPRNTRAVRVHVAGDFFSQDYFDAWMKTARHYPDLKFYAYTKSLPFWVARLGKLPSNFTFVASYGGRHDPLISAHNLPSAIVVSHPVEAEALGLMIDKDDSLAMKGQNLALLLHATQPAGSEAAAALQRMREDAIEFSYPV
jgi:hypothetical protein